MVVVATYTPAYKIMTAHPDAEDGDPMQRSSIYTCDECGALIFFDKEDVNTDKHDKFHSIVDRLISSPRFNDLL